MGQLMYRGGVFCLEIIMEYNKLCKMINDILPEAKKILPEDCLANDLGLCSFDMMMLIFQLEKECGHQISISDIKKDMTVKELFELVCI